MKLLTRIKASGFCRRMKWKHAICTTEIDVIDAAALTGELVFELLTHAL
jgi:hypothetical protein